MVETGALLLFLLPCAGPPTAAAPPAPVPAREAPARMALPEGFRATLFASEPDVRQPIAFTFDDRGRIWVAECYSYPRWITDGRPGPDRILILEDADGDGRSDVRKVFREGLANLTGLELGFGGVWACATPNLLFIPDADGDDRPDGDPRVVLDGWDLKCGHNAFNALRWGPDGWLYGTNGILSNSRVGRPGDPDSARVPLNCGVWRYHPRREAFEAVAHGTTNPWGLDFDDHGEMFISNCVIPHLFHVVPGARFIRMFGEDFDPHAYALLESCADHIHWAGGAWQDSRGGKGKHGEAGGGHAHAGAMVYLGDGWPEPYRGSIFLSNLHGNRINRDSLSRRGSGWIARHEKDFLHAGDEWFRALELKYGPDGAVYLTDWSDAAECHDTDAHGAHHESGRIYRISHASRGDARPARLDLAALDDLDLVRLQLHRNDWHVRQARRLLEERAARGADLARAHAALRRLFDENPEPARKLRALWTLHATGGLPPASLAAALGHEDEWVRTWAVRLLCEGRDPPPAALGKLAAMARSERSPRVRLELAAALQRLPLDRRWEVAAGLMAWGEDSADPNLPLMLWYAIEPLVASDPKRAAGMVEECRIPLLRRHAARRAASLAAGLPAVVGLLGSIGEGAFRLDLLAGLQEGLRGTRAAAPPAGWEEVYAGLSRSALDEVRERAARVGLAFADRRAAGALEAALQDPALPPLVRVRALESLAEHRVAGLGRRLLALLDDRAVRGAALRALAAYDEPEAPRAILERYPSLSRSERGDAIATLAARPAPALLLLEAVERGAVARHDLSAFAVRQLRSLGEPEVEEALGRVLGALNPTSPEKAALIARFKAELTPERLEQADLPRGRMVFDRACAQCHRLYDSGGDVGPDITGSNRRSLDYLLENILDPSAQVGRDHLLQAVRTRDGRLISGIIRERTERSITVQTPNERVVLARPEIRDLTPLTVSMMPEGTLDQLTREEIRDLIAYLSSPAQVPLPDPIRLDPKGGRRP